MGRIRIERVRQNWSEVYVGNDRIGGFGRTAREHPDMLWYWTANGTYGYCGARDEAIAGIEGTLPFYDRCKAQEAENQAAYEALPPQLKELKNAMDLAEFERMRVWGLNPFSKADYRSASDRWLAARLAFNKAHDEWLSRREAA